MKCNAIYMCVYFHCDVIVVSKLLYCLFCMLMQHSPGFGVQWPGGGWSSHLRHQLSVQAFCHLCLQCLWEDSRNGARWEFIVHVHVWTARARVLLYHSLALIACIIHAYHISSKSHCILKSHCPRNIATCFCHLIPAVTPAVHLLQIQEVHPGPHSNACNFCRFYLFFHTCTI